MKALILSGGKGTRLRPITYTGAKQLVPVANKPILFYGIESIKNAGITDIGIVVGDTRREIQDAVGDGSRFGVKISYIHQEKPLGLAHAVMIAEPFIGSDRFVMYLGDNLIKDGIGKLVQDYRQSTANSQILLAEVEHPEQFGVAQLKGDRIYRLEEKPAQPESNLALVGVYMFDHNVFAAVNNIQPSHRGELEITDAITWLVEKGLDVRAHKITGWWKDTGKLEDILEANRIILTDREGRIQGTLDKNSSALGVVEIGPGTRVIDSVIRGPVIIGADCHIERAYIGPYTSVADGCSVVGSEIEHSIVLEGSSILEINTRIEDSLLGRNVEISHSRLKPRALRFMLGDNSAVGIL